MWQLRQKAGNVRIITATVDVLPINPNGEVKLVYAPHVGGWSCVGGHIEPGDSWSSAALHELEEEVHYPWCRNILLGYQRYLRTGTFQMIKDER